MIPERFQTLLDKIMLAFPGQIKGDPETFKIWYGVVKDLPDENVVRAANMLIREREQLYPGTNLGATIRNMATPTLTEATVSTHLNKAIQINQSPDGNPYAYLKAISPELLEMVEAADLFNRQHTTDRIGFIIHDVSKQFIEGRRNQEKGFSNPAVEPMRMLPDATGAGEMRKLTDDERLKNLAKIREIRAQAQIKGDTHGTV